MEESQERLRRLLRVKQISACTDQASCLVVKSPCRTNGYHILGESRGMSLAGIISLKVIEEDEAVGPFAGEPGTLCPGGVRMDP